MRYVAEHTTIPIPKAIAWGVTAGELSWLGPYILMEAVEGTPLNGLILDEADKIKSEVSDETLEKIYRQVADILLQLNCHTFDKIGSIELEEHGGESLWSVCHRPMTMKFNEIERVGGIRTDPDQSQYYLEENLMSSDTASEAVSDHSSIQVLKAAIATADLLDTGDE
ncbi:hypothetical protein MBLNU459_g5529t1 [Dothideomycetes sp. NU459]